LRPVHWSPMPFGVLTDSDEVSGHAFVQINTCLQCLSAFSPIPTRTSSVQQLGACLQSPMPFGVLTDSDLDQPVRQCKPPISVSNAFRRSHRFRQAEHALLWSQE